MRFKGTFILLIVCVIFGAYFYFYEIRGGAQREKEREAENQLWKLETSDIQQIDIIHPDQHITIVRSSDKDWRITAPRSLAADPDELNTIVGSAANLRREAVVGSAVTDLTKYGLEPAHLHLELKTKDGKKYGISIGNSNPTGNSSYVSLAGKSEIYLVANSVARTFDKKLDDLRNHSVLSFEQWEAQSLDLKSTKGDVSLLKEDNRWWFRGKEKWAADSASVSSVLGSLSSARIGEFFDDNPDDYVDLGFDKPLVDLRLTYGKDRAIKHLIIGIEKSELSRKGTDKSDLRLEPKKAMRGKASSAPSQLYLAKDESRPDLFFVEKDLVDKLLKSPDELRDKALAVFQRWEIDSMTLTNANGTFDFTKSGGEWVLGKDKKKTNWETVNGILDAMEKQVREFIDKPGALPTYGLDKPAIHVVLKQGGLIKVDCAFGKETGDGVYAQLKGESFVKIADKESYDRLNKGESDFVDLSATAAAKGSASPQK